LTGTQIQGIARTTAEQIFQGKHMRFSEIGHVNIVADSRTIGSLVVGPEDRQNRLTLPRGFYREWDEMGFGLVIFSNLPIRIGACGVEVT